jgi:thioredoxin-related protein
MTREVYTDEEFIKFSRSQVFMRVFEDTDPEGALLARKFKIEGFPTLIILDSAGQEVDRIEGAMDTHSLIEELESVFQDAKQEKITL